MCLLHYRIMAPNFFQVDNRVWQALQISAFRLWKNVFDTRHGLGWGSSIHRETPRKSVRHLTQEETCSGGSKPRVPCRGQRASSPASIAVRQGFVFVQRRILLLVLAPSPSSEFLRKLLLESLFDLFEAAARPLLIPFSRFDSSPFLHAC